MKTERMTILMTPEQKAAIVSRAERLGLSAGEMLRRAVESYDAERATPAGENEALLNALADELSVAAKQARGALASANRELEITLKRLGRTRGASHGRN